MARIEKPDLDAESLRGLVSDITKGRGSVIDLYAMLLHSPPVASGWLEYLSAIRRKTSLGDAIRELVIMQIAALNDSSYEAAQHRKLALDAGLSEAQLSVLPEWQGSDRFDRREQGVLAYTDAMTRQVQVPDAVFANVAALFDTRALVELTATIAAYNMVSRFLEALEIRFP